MAEPDEAPPGAPTVCAPCRGTGQVISNLGGSPSQVTCPWCEGSGLLAPPEHDAQTHWRDAPGAPDADAGATGGAPAA